MDHSLAAHAFDLKDVLRQRPRRDTEFRLGIMGRSLEAEDRLQEDAAVGRAGGIDLSGQRV